MELRDLKSFVAVAEACGFRRAADHLGVEQSALSRRVRSLEDQLGVSLFERNRGGVRLTHAGKRFLDDVRLTLSHLDGAIRAVSAAGRVGNGHVKIGTVASISSSFCNRLLRTFVREHPAVVIDLVEGPPREHMAAILDRRLDVAFVTGEPNAVACDVEQLWHEPILVAVPADHPRANESIVELTSLRDGRFIVSRSAPGPEIHDFIIKRLSSLGVSPEIGHFEVGREALMALVGLGLGVTLVSGAEAGVTYPNVVLVPVAGETLPFSAVWSPENDNPALRRFLSIARAMARKHRFTAAEPSRNLDRSP
ncbi:MAG TPA: LysR substrate-binding domain-containing protein [Microvirga sp.]|nr:LysR substrate-binding domain-containing protein [Microvirga sp.]